MTCVLFALAIFSSAAAENTCTLGTSVLGKNKYCHINFQSKKLTVIAAGKVHLYSSGVTYTVHHFCADDVEACKIKVQLVLNIV